MEGFRGASGSCGGDTRNLCKLHHKGVTETLWNASHANFMADSKKSADPLSGRACETTLENRIFVLSDQRSQINAEF